MNRPRKSNKHLPPCVYFKHGAYWLVKKGKWERIGTTLGEALADYARRLETPKDGMAELVQKVLKHHGPDLSEHTLKTYRKAGAEITKAFKLFTPEQVIDQSLFKLTQGIDS